MQLLPHCRLPVVAAAPNVLYNRATERLLVSLHLPDAIEDVVLQHDQQRTPCIALRLRLHRWQRRVDGRLLVETSEHRFLRSHRIGQLRSNLSARSRRTDHPHERLAQQRGSACFRAMSPGPISEAKSMNSVMAAGTTGASVLCARFRPYALKAPS